MAIVYKIENFKPVLLFVVFFLGVILLCNAQFGTKAVIKNVNFELVDQKVIIKYDLVKAKSRDLFDIDVGIYSTSGYRIDAQTLEGKFTNVQKGKDQEIKWHLGKDYNFFDDNIYVELKAFHSNHLKVKKVSRIEAMTKSTLWPGWGSAETSLKKMNYVKGILAYGLLTTSFLSYRSSQLGGEYADFRRNFAWASLGMAGVIWMWDYGKILFSPNISASIRLDIEAANFNNKQVQMLSLKLNL